MTRESILKKNCKDRLERAGWMVIHLIQTNMNGIPDTLIIHPVKGFVFIEFKRLGRDPEELQKYRMKKLKEANVSVRVVDREADIDDLCT